MDYDTELIIELIMTDLTITGDLIYLFFVNLLTFVLYAWDKYLAQNGKWRIPEAVLIFFSVIGGAFGAICGMILFNHKTKIRLFKICIPLLLYIQLTLEILFRMEIVSF